MQPGHNQRRTGAEVLADMLAGYGVTHVFMVPAVLRRTFAEMERRTKIARVHCHGEKSAAYMADGYARASGKPGICMAHVIGALNLAAGLRDAYLAHSPVIAMTGGRDPKTKFRKVYQEIDDMPAFDPVAKMNVTTTRRRADRICSARPSVRPRPARPVPCICNFAATKGRWIWKRPRWRLWSKPSLPAFRHFVLNRKRRT
jgi:thiamine pyrophosphate-dependent acetolactate synthase large subunit-like protein